MFRVGVFKETESPGFCFNVLPLFIGLLPFKLSPSNFLCESLDVLVAMATEEVVIVSVIREGRGHLVGV